jgi:hypothetical protein
MSDSDLDAFATWLAALMPTLEARVKIPSSPKCGGVDAHFIGLEQIVAAYDWRAK